MSFKKSPLYKILTSRSPDTVKKALEYIRTDENFDADLSEKNGEGYLHLVAILEGENKKVKGVPSLVPVVYALANGGIEVDGQDNRGNTALHTAVMCDAGGALVNALFKVGVDPTITNKEGNTAGDYVPDDESSTLYATFEMLFPGLWKAVEDGEADKVEELLDYWCKIDQVKFRKSILEMAREKENERIVECLEKAGRTNEMVHSALGGDSAKVKNLLKDGDKVNMDTVDESYMDENGHVVPMPLLGVVGLYGLNDVVKVLVRKGADVNSRVLNPTTGEKQPLFYYVMKRSKTVNVDFVRTLEKADLSLITDDKHDILWRAFDRGYPLEVMEYLNDNDFSLFEYSRQGHTLRQKIMIRSIGLPEDEQRKNLLFVDEHILGYAANGNLERLKGLALDGYYDLNVENHKGKKAASLARKKGHDEVANFLEELDDFQVKVIQLHKAVENANMSEAKKYLDDRDMGRAKDRGGRTPLHKAVIYERRIIIKFLIKDYPETLNMKDFNGRTPLHFACALPDADDIVDSLLRAGADKNITDFDGKTPGDYRNKDNKFVAAERETLPGLDLWLRNQYHKWVDAIEEGDYNKGKELREELPEWLNAGDIMKQMYLLPGEEKPKDLLFVCVTNNQEEMALYLVEEGADAVIKGPYGKGGKVVTLREAAEERGMRDLAELAETAEEMAKEEDGELEDLADHDMDSNPALQNGTSKGGKGKEKNGHANGNANGQDTPEGEIKSKSCTIL
ncbi:ankyrin-1 [Lingula anatina]|uniref:Ankyrin-1 n=1 Tax=Lingula anatina TaxID=7574 RepID=A0A1S3J9Y3_LINAN|nr:ankyrin-1 [Lingula anatina]|eukprot:XP_013406684.1 ankyrin-1 [Lingula anatina]